MMTRMILIPAWLAMFVAFCISAAQDASAAPEIPPRSAFVMPSSAISATESYIFSVEGTVIGVVYHVPPTPPETPGQG